MRKSILIRLTGSLLAGLLVGLIISEVSFRTQSNMSRSSQVVELDIPEGAAEKTSQGISLVPDGLTFVEGDVLVVHNYDTVAHTLGGMYIPAGSTSRMTLNQPGTLTMTCSFRPSRTFGLDVREALTWSTRVKGILLAGLPLSVLLGLYSLVAWPLSPGKK